MKIVVNWPLAAIVIALIVIASACWMTLVLTHTIPPRVPSWLLALVGGGSLGVGSLVPVAQWIRSHVVTEDKPN
jgi:hypothetical protein